MVTDPLSDIPAEKMAEAIAALRIPVRWRRPTSLNYKRSIPIRLPEDCPTSLIPCIDRRRAARLRHYFNLPERP